MIDRRDHLDALLDEALKAYAEQEPPPGLERRVMCGISPATHWWRLSLPAAAVFAAVCFVMLTPRHSSPLKRLAPKYRAVEATITVREPARRRWRKRRSILTSDRELALLHFAQTYPDVLATLAHDDLVPIEIAPLTMAPLRVDELTTEELTQ